MDSRRSQAQATRQLKIMQEQVGHSNAATTAIYSGVSNEYRNKLMAARLRERLGVEWGVQG